MRLQGLAGHWNKCKGLSVFAALTDFGYWVKPVFVAGVVDFNPLGGLYFGVTNLGLSLHLMIKLQI